MVNPLTCRIEAYECLMRAVLPDGRIANPAEMISTARNAEVMQQAGAAGLILQNELTPLSVH